MPEALSARAPRLTRRDAFRLLGTTAAAAMSPGPVSFRKGRRLLHFLWLLWRGFGTMI